MAAVYAAPPARQQKPSARHTGLIISEIMYHPADREDNAELDFIEIVNVEPVAINIGGYRLSGEVDYTFPADCVLAPHTPRVVALDPAAITNAYGVTNVLGPFEGKLVVVSDVIPVVPTMCSTACAICSRLSAPDLRFCVIMAVL